jgi:hypothetical protein
MRQRLVLILLAGVVASSAAADPKRPPAKGKSDLIDVAPMLDKLAVYKDEYGKFLVAPRAGLALDSDAAEQWLFYGDQKGLYQQRVIGYGVSGGKIDWSVWAPRVRHMAQADLTQDDKGATLVCEMKESKYIGKTLAVMPADQAKTFLEHVPLHPPLWQRQSHLLARDDNGVYYFVDQLREEYGGNGFRVFIGQKGAMKEMPMKNVVSDSAGEIFATTNGDLKLVTTSKQGHEAYWKKGGKKEDLTLLEPQENRYLIYSELGVYGTLGAVCDEN